MLQLSLLETISMELRQADLQLLHKLLGVLETLC